MREHGAKKKTARHVEFLFPRPSAAPMRISRVSRHFFSFLRLSKEMEASSVTPGLKHYSSAIFACSVGRKPGERSCFDSFVLLDYGAAIESTTRAVCCTPGA